MTPKTKAGVLIHKHLNYFGLDKDEVNDEKAKQSALITVDEILKVLDGFSYTPTQDYWQSVRQEIEQL